MRWRALFILDNQSVVGNLAPTIVSLSVPWVSRGVSQECVCAICDLLAVAFCLGCFCSVANLTISNLKKFCFSKQLFETEACYVKPLLHHHKTTRQSPLDQSRETSSSQMVDSLRLGGNRLFSSTIFFFSLHIPMIVEFLHFPATIPLPYPTCQNSIQTEWILKTCTFNILASARRLWFWFKVRWFYF